MREKLIAFLMVVVAVIHLLPLMGILGVDKLNNLYGITIADNNLEILMRHRAMLFGLLGLFFVVAAFKRIHQPMAFLLAFISLISFLYLSWSIGGYNEAIARVVTVDLIALGALLVAVVLYFTARKN